MNSLPVQFYEKVALNFTKNTLTAGTKIPRRIGAVCSEFLEQTAFHAIEVSKHFSKSKIFSLHKVENGRCSAIERTSRKHLHNISIYLIENTGHGPIDPAVTQIPISSVFLWLYTSNLSKEVVNIADSIPIVSLLAIATPVTETIERIMEKMVEKKTLNCLDFRTEHQFNAATTEALVDLLKQEQFAYVVLCANCDLPLERIIAEWRDHSEKMTGKAILCKSTVVKNPIGDFGFEQSTEEEMDYLDRYHSQRQSSRMEHEFILKNRNGRAICVLGDEERQVYKNILIFM